MKKELLIPALVLFVTISFFSCKKDIDKSKTDFLTQSGWKIVTSQADPGTGTYLNEPVDDCVKDDILKFNSDHSYATTVGAQCDPTDTNDTGSWTLSSDEKTLTVDGDDAAIEALDNNTLVMVYTEVFGGLTYRYKITMGH